LHVEMVVNKEQEVELDSSVSEIALKVGLIR